MCVSILVRMCCCWFETVFGLDSLVCLVFDLGIWFSGKKWQKAKLNLIWAEVVLKWSTFGYIYSIYSVPEYLFYCIIRPRGILTHFYALIPQKISSTVQSRFWLHLVSHDKTALFSIVQAWFVSPIKIMRWPAYFIAPPARFECLLLSSDCFLWDVFFWYFS